MRADTYDALSLVRGAMCLSDRAWCETRKKHQRIDISQPGMVYYLDRGCVSECCSGGKRILRAPAFFGLNTPTGDIPAELHCRENCDIWVISRDDFDALLNERTFLLAAFELLSASTLYGISRAVSAGSISTDQE